MWSTLRSASAAPLLLLGLSACFELSSDDEDFVPIDAAGVEATVSFDLAKGFAYCDVIVRQPDGTAISETRSGLRVLLSGKTQPPQTSRSPS